MYLFYHVNANDFWKMSVNNFYKTTSWNNGGESFKQFINLDKGLNLAVWTVSWSCLVHKLIRTHAIPANGRSSCTLSLSVIHIIPGSTGPQLHFQLVNTSSHWKCLVLRPSHCTQLPGFPVHRAQLNSCQNSRTITWNSVIQRLGACRQTHRNRWLDFNFFFTSPENWAQQRSWVLSGSLQPTRVLWFCVALSGSISFPRQSHLGDGLSSW